jgi:hypothetical protein
VFLSSFFAIGLTHLTDCDRIRIDMVNVILKRFNKKQVQTEASYKRELMIKQAGDQFKKMVERGLDLPVVLLN